MPLANENASVNESGVAFVDRRLAAPLAGRVPRHCKSPCQFENNSRGKNKRETQALGPCPLREEDTGVIARITVAALRQRRGQAELKWREPGKDRPVGLSGRREQVGRTGRKRRPGRLAKNHWHRPAKALRQPGDQTRGHQGDFPRLLARRGRRHGGLIGAQRRRHRHHRQHAPCRGNRLHSNRAIQFRPRDHSLSSHWKQ